MRRNIHSLKDLSFEKALLRARMRTVEDELLASALRTRDALEAYIEGKMDIPNQIGKLLKDDAEQSLGTTLLRTLIQAIGVNRRWGNVLLVLAPVAISYARKKWTELRQAKRRETSTVSVRTVPSGNLTSPH